LNNIDELGDIYKTIQYALYPKYQPITKSQSVVKNKRGKEFNLMANASIIGVKEASTNITVEKLIDYDETNSTPKLILRITTPPIDKMDIVLSLDSSGSMGLSNGDMVIKNGLKDSINAFMEELHGKNISSRFSIVSWDDKVDFIYRNNGTNIRGIDPNNTILVNATTLKNDLESSIIPYYHSEEEEATNLETGIISPLMILGNNKPIHSGTFRCVVLVVGRGEFKNYTKNISSNLKLYPFMIYPLGINPGREMEKSLKNLADISNGKYIYTTGSTSDFKDELDNLLEKFLEEAAHNTSVARNVIIYESLYPYLEPDLSSLKGARLLSYDGKTNK